ncbi:hypothetical protein SCUP234_06377 [Seiridium cupressi]
MASLLLAAAFGAVAQAIAIESTIAQPTSASLQHPTVQRVEVTQAPNPSVVRELLKRAEAQTVLVGPDNTCGYVSGLFGAAYTCGDTSGYCAFITTASLGVVACCDDSSCDFRTDCRDKVQVADGDCDNGCMNDIYTAKCTDSDLPYCGTILFSNSITDYFCQSLSYSTAMDALTTYIGETDGRSYSEVVITLTSDGITTKTSSNSGSTTKSGSITSSAAGSSSSSGSNSGGSGGGGSSTNIGAIVGGVVGGVAVLALVAFGIWFMVRRSKKNKTAATASAAPAAYPQMQQSPPPGAPSPGPMGGAAAGHQSVYNPQYPQQPGQQYPSPQSYQSPQDGAYFHSQEKPAEPYVVGQAPMQPTSPMSQATDPRLSMQPSSPTSTMQSFQPQHTGGTYPSQNPSVPSTVYEAGGDAVGNQGHNANHRGQFHELG